MSHQSLTRRGYVVKKKYLTPRQKLQIKRELCFKPIVMPAFQQLARPKQFYTYLESDQRFYLPRYYGVETFGPPIKNQIEPGKPINVNYYWDILPHQEQAWKALEEKFSKNNSGGALDDSSANGGIFSFYCGGGKCLGKDTPILLYNGKFKMSQDIRPGDLLMGDNSQLRTVLSVARGKEMMYRITPTHGDPYVVNESHILSLKFSSECLFQDWKYQAGEVIDLPITKYLCWQDLMVTTDKGPRQLKEVLKGFRVPVTFRSLPLSNSPYELGYLLIFSSKIGKIRGDSVEILKKNGIQYQSFIPYCYKCNERNQQLQLLAGILDVLIRVNNNGNNNFQLEVENQVCRLKVPGKLLKTDLIFLCRSLGYNCFQEEDWLVLSGCLSEIPTREKKIKLPDDPDHHLLTEIVIQPTGVDDYYGFTLDGNGRFILGDFQVTHNTALSIRAATKVIKRKTLVVVNKEFLMNQWVDAIQACTNARVGIIQQKKVDVENKDIVIAMLHSLAKKDYPEEIFQDFGFSIWDECIKLGQKVRTREGWLPIEELYQRWQVQQEADFESLNALEPFSLHPPKPLPRVLALNLQTQQYEWKRITYAWERRKPTVLRLSFHQTPSGQSLECTPNHLLLTPSGQWLPAGELQPGDQVVTCHGDFISQTRTISQVSEVRPRSRSKGHLVYDLEIEDHHNFVVEGVVAHNCHHVASQMFSLALPKVATEYSLGLSATPYRRDGLTPVFMNYLGPIFYTERRSGTNQVWIKFLEIDSASKHFAEEVQKISGNKNTVKMINNLSEYETLNYFILDLIRLLLEDKPRKILVLGSRREQLEWLNETCLQANFKNSKNKYVTSGLYYGKQRMNKKAYYKMLEESARCDVIWGTNEIASEGLDIPDLNTLILLNGGTNVEQAVGRILRKFHKEIPPVVVDLVYRCGNFPKHAKLRRDYYDTEDYNNHKLRVRLGDNCATYVPYLPKVKEFFDEFPEPTEAERVMRRKKRLKTYPQVNNKFTDLPAIQTGNRELIAGPKNVQFKPRQAIKIASDQEKRSLLVDDELDDLNKKQEPKIEFLEMSDEEDELPIQPDKWADPETQNKQKPVLSSITPPDKVTRTSSRSRPMISITPKGEGTQAKKIRSMATRVIGPPGSQGVLSNSCSPSTHSPPLPKKGLGGLPQQVDQGARVTGLGVTNRKPSIGTIVSSGQAFSQSGKKSRLPSIGTL